VGEAYNFIGGQCLNWGMGTIGFTNRKKKGRKKGRDNGRNWRVSISSNHNWCIENLV